MMKEYSSYNSSVHFFKAENMEAQAIVILMPSV